MIISHRHQFIFFAVPKTATHAIRQALAAHLGPDDWQQQALFGKDELPISDLAAIGHGHLSVKDVMPHLSGDVWRHYLRFAFVRNPYDRFVSACFFLFRHQRRFAESANPFMKSALSRPQFRRRVLVQPQVLLLTGPDGELAMDRIGRYESLQASFDEICLDIGVQCGDLARQNSSTHRHYSEYYDVELAGMVAEYYREDFEQLGYDTVLASSRD